MKRRRSSIWIVLVFLAGVGLLVYPSFSNYWNARHQTRAIIGYTESVVEIDNRQYEAMIAAAEEYNARLAETGVLWNLSDEQTAEYESLLSVTDQGIMGYIEIRKINVLLPLYHGTSDAVLQVAIGHLEGTSLPVGGESSHCVLSGHRGLPSARLFTDLDKLSTGDTFILRTLDEVYTYEVDQIRIVEPTDMTEIQIEDGEDYCTLVTCTPYGINTHRLLVRGRRVENEAQKRNIRVTADALQVSTTLVAVMIAVPLTILFFAGLILNDRWRKRI